MSDAWNALTDHMSSVARLAQIQGLLSWDQQVNLPPSGHADRGAHAALISGLIQQRATDAQVGEWLAALESADLDEVQRGGLRNHRRTYERANKIPADLTERAAHASMEGYAAWTAARESGDYAKFAPALQTAIDLALEEARCIDPDRHPYDVLLELYDPGTTLADLRTTFGRLREGLVELIDAVRDVEPMAPVDVEVPVEAQRAWHGRITDAMGYDRNRGRVDAAIHPFTVTMGADDVRITTRLMPDDLLGGLGGTMHEAGHALYELGIPRRTLGTGVDSAASLGVHESQSRFWENAIGRSRPFFGWAMAQLDEVHPGTGLSAEDLYRAANRVQPSKIRIFADEVTYNLHIIVRFELEVALLEGRLSVEELPAAWNKAYAEYLGVEIENDLEGVLQDVHWSGGTIGYFPSYTLGNLYAASLLKTLEGDVPDLWERVGRGELSPVLDWLRDKIHRHGHRLDGADLVREVVGEVDLVENLLDYLWARHGALHGVTRPGR